MSRETKTILLIGLCLVMALLMAVALGINMSHREREPAVHTVMMMSPETESGAEDGTEDGTEGGRTAISRTSVPKAENPEVKAPAEEIPADYFDDALIAGTGIVATLGRYDYDGMLRNADIVETDTLTDTSWLQDLEDGVYGKVYLGLGAEELEWNSDEMKNAVTETVKTLQSTQPGAVIYLMNVTPVSEYRSGSNRLTTKERIVLFNNMLYDVARNEGVRYLDVYSVLCDEDGFLPSEVTEDGMTFTPAHYGAWYELLRTHYVPLSEDKEG